MICPKCGADIANGSQFCPKCSNYNGVIPENERFDISASLDYSGWSLQHSRVADEPITSTAPQVVITKKSTQSNNDISNSISSISSVGNSKSGKSVSSVSSVAKGGNRQSSNRKNNKANKGGKSSNRWFIVLIIILFIAAVTVLVLRFMPSGYSDDEYYEPDEVITVSHDGKQNTENTAVSDDTRMSREGTGYLDATDEDFYNLTCMISSYDKLPEYDCTGNFSCGICPWVTSVLLSDTTAIPAYSMYFGSYERIYDEVDPEEMLTSYDSYAVLPEENVRWIIENVFDVQYTNSSSVQYYDEVTYNTVYDYTASGNVSDRLYLYDGYYYIGLNTYKPSLDCEKTGDSDVKENGHYRVSYKVNNNESGESTSFTVEAGLRNIGGNRVWTIYKII